MITITDPYVYQMIKYINSASINFMIHSSDESDRDDRSDLEILIDEIEYALDMYESDGTIQNQALCEARKIQKDTKRFSVIPVNKDLEPIYTNAQTASAVAVLNEYKRLTSSLRKARERYSNGGN